MKCRELRAAVLLGGMVLAGCLQKNDAAPCATNAQAGSNPDGATAGTASATAGATTSGGGSESAEAGTTGAAAGGSAAAAATGGSGAAAATGGVLSGGSGGGPPDSTACAQVALEQCASTADCGQLSGQRITGDPLCITPLEVVACGTSLGCTAQATRATDMQGQDWIFPTACIPAGWADASTSGVRFDPCPEGMGAGGATP